MAGRSLSYQFDEFMKYLSVNDILPQHLVPYCTQDVSSGGLDLSSFNMQLPEIIAGITRGDNPDIITFRNFIKYYINKIHQGNYGEYLGKLEALNYPARDNIHFLASELIICAIRHPISVKGFTFTEDPKYRSVPEICVDVIKQFSTKKITVDNGKGGTDVIGFHEELMKLCEEYFYDFMDLTKSLDENNENTSDNYKGFMTLMGLLYGKGLIGIKVVIDCMDTIKKSIFCSVCKSKAHESKSSEKHYCDDVHTKHKKQIDIDLLKTICYYCCNKCTRPSESNNFVTYRKHIECEKLHKGYEHLLTHVLHSLESRIADLIANMNDKSNTVTKLQALLNAYNSGEHSKEFEKYIMSKCTSDFKIKTDVIYFQSYADFVSSFENTDATSKAINDVLGNDLTLAKNIHRDITTSFNKLCEYVDIIIKSHQEFVQLNQIYKSMNKTQLVVPLKPHLVITHNSIGTNLNKLHDKLLKQDPSSKYVTKYKPVAITK